MEPVNLQDIKEYYTSLKDNEGFIEIQLVTYFQIHLVAVVYGRNIQWYSTAACEYPCSAHSTRVGLRSYPRPCRYPWSVGFKEKFLRGLDDLKLSLYKMTVLSPFYTL